MKLFPFFKTKTPEAAPESRLTPVGRDKKKIAVGLFFIVAAFIGVVAIFYAMMDVQRAKDKEADALQADVVALTAEKDLAQTKIADLEQEMAKVPEWDRVIRKADRLYGDEEKTRREGLLWIDRKNESFIVTLGALQGLARGSRLTVYDGREKAGMVEVDLAMDVISYVLLVNATAKDFDKDYYRVVPEP